jgi:hypothetical protein
MRAYLILIIFLSSCIIDDTKKPGMSKRSQSIKESKKNGVFEFEIQISDSVINIDNGNTDTIIEAWVEKEWEYNNRGNIIKDSTMQILMLLKKLSKNSQVDIWFKNESRYWGWNGVVFSPYNGDSSKVFVIKNQNGIDSIETILDTINFYRKK